MTLAIVGCGHIAQAYADGVDAYSDLSLVAAADLQMERAVALAEPYGATPYPDVDTLLAEEEVDLVANLTLHEAHAPVTSACLSAGCHVFSEKPLAVEATTARTLVQQAEANGVTLGCAPLSGWADVQQQAARLLRDGHIGTARIAYAVGNFGRLTDWNANPEPFLRVGPLYDGAVYPLTVLTTIYGPVTRVRTADVSLLLDTHTHEGRTFTVETPDHVTATLELEQGPLVQLTTSMYVPYQTKHFSSLEIHGDAGSLYLDDCGTFDGNTSTPPLQVARLGRAYRPLPLQRPPTPLTYAAGIADVARAATTGHDLLASGRHAAHLVSIIEAIYNCAETGQATPVDAVGFAAPALLPWANRSHPHRTVHPLAPSASPSEDTPAPNTPAIPPIGFGCSRYRGGTTYVDLDDAMADALAAGIRLFDTAELYGTESMLGDRLNDLHDHHRERVFLVSKAWNTNHHPDHLRAAAEASVDRLGVDRLDAYLLHNPTAWVHQEPLGDVSNLSHEEATARTFPTDDEGAIKTADNVALADTWTAMEALVEDGLTRHIGLCNVDSSTLTTLLEIATIPPQLVQVECHPYHRPAALIEQAHTHGLRVMAHSPLSAPGLLDDPVVHAVAQSHDVAPAQVILRWLVQHHLVPIPSSTRANHVHANADVFGFALSDADMERLNGLHQPNFSRD